jgi:hypothetical protein
LLSILGLFGTHVPTEACLSAPLHPSRHDPCQK